MVVVTTIGLCLPQLGPVVSTALVRDFSQQAEGMGFAHLWAQDHFLFALSKAGAFGGKGTDQPDIYQSVWAPTELLAAVAGWTTTMELGTSVLVTGNHWPAQLAGRLATIDQLSGGRLAYVGLGVGWSEEEMRAMGVDPRGRGKRADEFVPVLRACWGDDPVEYHGSVFDIEPAIVRPKPISTPKLVSGMYAPKGLDRTVQHFDMWNPASTMTVPEVVQAVDAMNARRPEGLAPLDVCYRLVQTNSAGERTSIDEMLRRAEQSVDAGFACVILETNYNVDIADAAAWLEALNAFEPILAAADARHRDIGDSRASI